MILAGTMERRNNAWIDKNSIEKGSVIMSLKKISINLSEENEKKLELMKKETGMSQTELINHAIANVPIIALGDRKEIAISFFDLRRLMKNKDYKAFCKEGEQICRSLNLLMEKIGELQH